jgi:hypothetical protein
MANIQTSFLISTVSGKCNGSTFTVTSQGIILRKNKYNNNTKATSENTYKAIYGNLSSEYNNLTSEEVQTWRNNKIGKASGRNLFIKMNYNRKLCFKSILNEFVGISNFPSFNCFNIFVSRSYQSILIVPLFPINSNFYIKVKASKQHKHNSNVSRPNFKEICILTFLPSDGLDIFQYWSSRYNTILQAGSKIFFEISFIDITNGSESNSWYYTSFVNYWFDIYFGSGTTSCIISRTSNNFSSVDTLKTQAGSNYCYQFLRITDKCIIATTWTAPGFLITFDNGLNWTFFSVNSSVNFIYSILTDYNKYIYLTHGDSSNITLINYLTSTNNAWKICPGYDKISRMVFINPSYFVFSSDPDSSDSSLFYGTNNINNVTKAISASFTNYCSLLFFWDSLRGIAINHTDSTHSTIMITNDAGKNWTSMLTPSANYNHNFFVPGPSGFFCIGSVTLGRILHTHDYGANWEESGTLFSLNLIRVIVRFDNDNIIAVCSAGAKVLLSTDNGHNWNIVYTVTGANQGNGYVKLSATCAIINCSPTGKFIITYNSGVTWSVLYSNSSLNFAYSLMLNNNIQE